MLTLFQFVHHGNGVVFHRNPAFSLFVGNEVILAQTKVPGSLPWIEARYGLALAYFRSNKPKDAVHLIDATAILHPDLGGAELKEKFIKLRRRIEPAA